MAQIPFSLPLLASKSYLWSVYQTPVFLRISLNVDPVYLRSATVRMGESFQVEDLG
jgi:hypothetical protein